MSALQRCLYYRGVREEEVRRIIVLVMKSLGIDWEKLMTILPEYYKVWFKVAHNTSFVEPEESHKLGTLNIVEKANSLINDEIRETSVTSHTFCLCFS